MNTTTNQEQSHPSVAMDADGDFAIVWQGRPGNFDVFLQQYAADGSSHALLWGTRNAAGDMVMLGSVVEFRASWSPSVFVHH